MIILTSQWNDEVDDDLEPKVEFRSIAWLVDKDLLKTTLKKADEILANNEGITSLTHADLGVAVLLDKTEYSQLGFYPFNINGEVHYIEQADKEMLDVFENGKIVSAQLCVAKQNPNTFYINCFWEKNSFDSVSFTSPNINKSLSNTKG